MRNRFSCLALSGNTFNYTNIGKIMIKQTDKREIFTSDVYNTGRRDYSCLHIPLYISKILLFCSLSVPHPSLFRYSDTLSSYNKALTVFFSFPPRLQNRLKSRPEGLLAGYLFVSSPFFVPRTSLIRSSDSGCLLSVFLYMGSGDNLS